MKRKPEIAIRLSAKADDEVIFLQVTPEQLRDMINFSTVSPKQETLSLSFNFKGKQYSKDFNLCNINSALKRAELLTSIVPSYLENYLKDFTHELAKNKTSKIIGREHELEKAWFFLSQKTRNNVFLIGENDVGKTAIATEIAMRIAGNTCPKEFYNKRVLMLKPNALLKIKSNLRYEFIVEQILNFLIEHKDRVILYVDKAIYMKSNIHLIYLLYACLKEHNIPLIVTSSEDNFEDYFYGDQSIAKYINYIPVEEPELNEVEPMVLPYVNQLVKNYGIKISDKMIKYAIFTSVLSSSVSANPGRVINIFERAFLEAKRKDKEEVDRHCILSCYDARVKEYTKMPEEEKRSTAYHETGHYILFVKSKNLKNVKISCVSILPMNWWAGVTIQYHDMSEYAVNSKEYYLDYIAMYLAGRIAEKKFTNLNSTGASGDLKYANDMAKVMIMQWGFSDNSSSINRQYDYMDYYLMPEQKKQAIDDEIQQLIDEGTKRATQVIEENEGLLKIIAEKLLVEDVLTGEELRAICQEHEQS